MGLLIPEEFPLDTVHQGERRVVRILQEGLSDSWLIIPQVKIEKRGRTYESDIFLLNDFHGMYAIEVKTGQLEIRDGEWYRRGEIIAPSPMQQSHNAAYEIRNRLRKRKPALLRHVHVAKMVAMPDISGLDELGDGLPTEVMREQLLFSDDLVKVDGLPLEEIFSKLAVDGLPLEHVFSKLSEVIQSNLSLTAKQIEAVVKVLRPDQDFRWDPQAQARVARTTLRRITDGQTRALATLDMNERVVVSGTAGSGKTRLALTWVERALARKERTLLTCFNEPMAATLREASPENELLTVGPVQKTLLDLEDFPKLSVPENMSSEEASEWWSHAPFDHIAEHLTESTTRFDTIIIDEAQDFAPRWFETLEGLLSDEGSTRLMKLADPQQEVFDQGFILESPGPGVVRVDLSMNCRNTQIIARLLRQFGGAEAAPASPEGQPVEFFDSSTDTEAASQVGRLLERLVSKELIDPANILVVTGSTSMRDQIIDENPGGFVCDRWEERFEGNIVCETIHRTKGLERDAVILVTSKADLPDNLLYVGMSRAISKLIIVGPPALRARLGLGNEEMTSD